MNNVSAGILVPIENPHESYFVELLSLDGFCFFDFLCRLLSIQEG